MAHMLEIAGTPGGGEVLLHALTEETSVDPSDQDDLQPQDVGNESIHGDSDGHAAGSGQRSGVPESKYGCDDRDTRNLAAVADTCSPDRLVLEAGKVRGLPGDGHAAVDATGVIQPAHDIRSQRRSERTVGTGDRQLPKDDRHGLALEIAIEPEADTRIAAERLSPRADPAAQQGDNAARVSLA